MCVAAPFGETISTKHPGTPPHVKTTYSPALGATRLPLAMLTCSCASKTEPSSTADKKGEGDMH
ncbi:hypothetical protein BCR44DRAFT_34303 [Catenaria anguillulae PL171]|uniref:Uncharacterized protein n=1 Tax=Catenaria anguillulae PL171 TaxID=765915 RepID=A0A1Y2HKZ2_9FUNG|nr:hypothetical protein BCR44DRAFT_34303 [Catenaria anguillulae PL171]